MRVIGREVVERTAYIIGPTSAAAAALTAADAMLDPVFLVDGDTIIVTEGAALTPDAPLDPGKPPTSPDSARKGG